MGIKEMLELKFEDEKLDVRCQIRNLLIEDLRESGLEREEWVEMCESDRSVYNCVRDGLMSLGDELGEDVEFDDEMILEVWNEFKNEIGIK